MSYLSMLNEKDLKDLKFDSKYELNVETNYKNALFMFEIICKRLKYSTSFSNWLSILYHLLLSAGLYLLYFIQTQTHYINLKKN